jgi:quinol monooxygenase YgiN
VLSLTAFIEVLPKDRDAIHSALVDVIASTRAEEGCEK